MMIQTSRARLAGLGATGTMTFTASRADLTQLQIGDVWSLDLHTDAPYAPVQGAAYHNQNYSSNNAGVTDSNGAFSLSGSFAAPQVGTWQQVWRVDGSQIGGMIQFTVQGPPYNPALYDVAANQAATIGGTTEPNGPPVYSGYGGTAQAAQELANQIGTEAANKIVTGQATPAQLGIDPSILPPSLVGPLSNPPATITAPTTATPNPLVPSTTPGSSSNPLAPATPATSAPPLTTSAPPSTTSAPPLATSTPAVTTTPAAAGTIFGIDQNYVLIGGAALLALLLLGRR